MHGQQSKKTTVATKDRNLSSKNKDPLLTLNDKTLKILTLTINDASLKLPQRKTNQKYGSLKSHDKSYSIL